MGSKLGVFLVFLFFGTGAFSQYKQDIGLKIGSLEEERAQLDYRFHLKFPYTIIASYAYNSNTWSDEGGYVSYFDSTYSVNSEFHQYWFHTVKIGVQRKISGFASDVFYTGATVGVGYKKQRNSYSESTFFFNDTIPAPPPFSYVPGSELSFTELHQYTRTLQAQLAFSFGMDVPISKRFLINAEIGLIGNLAKNAAQNGLSAEITMAFSGGVRYQFGVRK
jgi:hypothetical protein